LRSLACLRIALGLLLLLDLGIRFCWLEAHYCDTGAQPRGEILRMNWHPEYWSLFMVTGSWPLQVLLFLFTGLCYLCLAVGYRTRTASLLSWVMLISLQNRNGIIEDGGDSYFRLLLFWLAFTPWGARWSVDAARCPPPSTTARAVLGWSGFAYLWQLSLIYWVAWALKSAPEWTTTGTALQQALAIDQITSPPAAWLRPYPQTMKFLTFAVLYFEGCVPFLFWINGWTRAVAVLGLTLMHLGFGTFMHLGVFAPVASIASWGLIPGRFWEALARVRAFPRGRWPLPGGENPAPRPERWPMRALQLYLLLRITQMNWVVFQGSQFPPHPQDLRFLRLDQRWNMFAPRPLVDDGYCVAVGETRSGEWVNLWLQGGALEWEKPAQLASHYPDARWRKLMMNLQLSQGEGWRAPLLAYLCRRWQRAHPERPLRSARLYAFRESTQVDGREAPPHLLFTAYLGTEPLMTGSELRVYPTLESGLEVLRLSRGSD